MSETVGELIERLGEAGALTHIVAYNIKLRMAASDVLVAWEESQPYMKVAAIEALRKALEGDE